MFRNEFDKHANVTYYGSGYRHKGEPDVQKIINKLGPFDYVMTYGYKYCQLYESMKDLQIPHISFMIDYFPRNFTVKNNFLTKHEPEICILRSSYCLELFLDCQRAGKVPEKVKPLMFPLSVDTHFFKPRGLDRYIDICASMSENRRVYKKRPQVKAACHELSPPYTVISDRFDPKVYTKILSQSKIFVNSNGKRNCMTLKYMEAMASGCLLVTDKPFDFEKVGFKDTKNCIMYSDIEELKDKLKYYLSHPKILKRIAKKGCELVTKKHNHSVRVKEILNAIKKTCPI